MQCQKEGWQLQPIKGNTGKAYMAIKNGKKLFLKYNTSPFLAILSMEQITPKLIWTKRSGDGDIITAQEWCNGRTLKSKEMKDKRVINLLSRIHNSELLFKMLKKVGGKTYLPRHMLMNYRMHQDRSLIDYSLLGDVYAYLSNHIPEVLESDLAVCHSDVSRKNWLLSETDKLYLVDWDAAMISDRKLDLGMLLTQYVPETEWSGWLREYGLVLTPKARKDIKWYGMMIYLLSINTYAKEKDYTMRDEYMRELAALFETT